MLCPDSFLLSVNYFTKLERLHRMTSRAITGGLSSSPIPLLSEASRPFLRVTLTHFALSYYERALRLPTSFPISDLARLAVKPRLSRFSWRTFASIHPLMPALTSPREDFLLALPLLSKTHLTLLWSPPFPLHVPPLIPLSLAKVRLSLTLTLSHITIWCSGQTTLFLFPFGKGGSGVLDNCSQCGIGATLFFSAGPVCLSFSAETYTILEALRRSRKH